MKKQEIKNDPIAEKIVYFINYLKNNFKLVLLITVILFIVVGFISYNSSLNKKNKINALKEVDKIMIELVGSGINNFEITDSIKNKINSLYTKYPNSEALSYLGLLIFNSDSINNEEKINLIKNNISNTWFKTQAFLISGDYYSDIENYKTAKKDYKQAIKYSASNAQKAYSYYKLGNVYFEENNLEDALNQYEKADILFNQSESLQSNIQFKDWDSRNKVALYRVQNLLKK